MSKKDIERRKKFMLELLGDPIYKPMRLRDCQKRKRETSMMFWMSFVMRVRYLLTIKADMKRSKENGRRKKTTVTTMTGEKIMAQTTE